MKTILIFSTILFSCKFCFAQRVTYKNLNYVYYHNIDQVEEYLSAKGFDYKGADTSSLEKKIYSSNFVKKNINYTNEIIVSKTSIDGEPLDASFQTYLKSDYITFKSYIKKIGYTFFSSTTGENGSLYIVYMKGKLFIDFNLSTLPSTRNLYTISFAEKIQ